MKRAIPTLICCLLFSNLVFTQSVAWQQKIDPSVLQSAKNNQLIEYMVLMEAQADLSKSELFRNKKDKGAYAYQQLHQLAASSQQNVVQMIRGYEAEYQSFWVVNTLWVKSDLRLIEELARLPEVAGIHPNPRVKFEGPHKTTTTSLRDPQGVEWGITTIGADQVWALGHTGAGIVVGGQDTGVEWDHLAIKDQYRGWNGSTADHNYNWHDAIHTAPANPCGVNTVVPCDDNDHGTHTIGTIAGDDGGSNQIGVAPGAKWMACRNMDENNGTPSTYIECFQWFLAPTDLNNLNPDASKAPHVINNSWSCPTSEGCNTGNFATMEMAVNNLRSAGVVVIASAGNSGSACSTVNAPPSIFAGSLSVGATNSSDAIAGFSSRGDVTVDGSNQMKPNVSAPGVNVRSCIPGGGYASWNGTSMAGPHVVGTVALILSAVPGLAGNVAQVESLLESTSGGQTTTLTCGGIPAGNSPNNIFGHGRIDALAAVNAAIALPVELTAFYAVAKESSIQLHWQTASEYNSAYFELEKSKDLDQWEIVGKIPGQQHTQITQQYAYEDLLPYPGLNYYRLRQVDLDGSFEWSKVITASLKNQVPSFSIYPNPTREQLTLQMDQLSTPSIHIYIFDQLGRPIYQQEEAVSQSKSHRILTHGWISGMYYLVIKDEQGRILFAEELLKN